MGDDLYFTRLRWHNGAGVAKLHGRSVVLTAPPNLGDGPVCEIDYAPEARCWEILPECGARREMTMAEIRAADALLTEVTR